MYKDFTVGHVFRIESAKGKCTRDLISANGLNYVAAKKTNNGVADRCSYLASSEADIISDGNCMVFVQLGDGSAGYTTYQSDDFVGMSGKISCGYIDGILNEEIGMYLMAVLDKNKQLFSYSASWTGERLRNTIMSLPIKTDSNGKPIIDETHRYHDEGFIPDWEYMQERIAELEQERIAELEQERIAELEQYLVATGLNDYELTEEDIETLSLSGFGDYEKSDSKDAAWVYKEIRKFRIGDILTVDTPKKKFNANAVVISENEGYPYVVRSSTNNGIRGYIKEDEKFLNDGNTFSFGQDTATVFWQPNAYFTGDKIKVLTPKFECNEEVAQYIINRIEIAFSNFTWGSQSFKEKIIRDMLIDLPIQTNDDGTPVIDAEHRYHPEGFIPDWKFMEKYIRAIEKVVIADVMKFKNEMIEKTKEIVA